MNEKRGANAVAKKKYVAETVEEEKMKPTSGILTGLVVLALLPVTSARGSLTMTVLSETYRASGRVGFSYWGFWPDRAYNVVSSRPPAFGEISGRLDWYLPPGDFEPISLYWDEDGEYSVHVWSRATRYSGSNGVVFEAQQYASHCPWCAAMVGSPLSTVEGWASASLTVDFTLSGPDSYLDIQVLGRLAGSGTYTAEANLADLTGGQSWFLWSASRLLPEMYEIPVTEGHIYRLTANARMDDCLTPSFINMQFTNVSMVPAPGAALLAAIGVGCLAGWLRRRM